MNHIDRIIKMGEASGWKLREPQGKNTLLIFVKDTRQINIWYTKMTIGTLLNHPKQGRNMLYRRNVSFEELEKVFNNPREHISKGYRIATPAELNQWGFDPKKEVRIHNIDRVEETGFDNENKPVTKTRTVFFVGHKIEVPKDMTDSELIEQLFKNGERMQAPKDEMVFLNEKRLDKLAFRKRTWEFIKNGLTFLIPFTIGMVVWWLIYVTR